MTKKVPVVDDADATISLLSCDSMRISREQHQKPEPTLLMDALARGRQCCGICSEECMSGRRGEILQPLVAHLEGGMGHISLNLLRTDAPMPRPFFEIKTPMLPWTLDSGSIPFGAEKVRSDSGDIWSVSRSGRR